MRSAELLVVGVDGSPDSQLALEYAVSEAVLHGAVLRVVTAFESAGRFGARYGVPIAVSDQQIAEKVEAETVALINDVIGTRPDPPKVQVVVQAGVTGRVLTEVSAEAASQGPSTTPSAAGIGSDLPCQRSHRGTFD